MNQKIDLIKQLAKDHGLITTKRDREIVYKRYYLYSELRPYCSLQQIGDIFEKDHASVCHGIKAHHVWMKAKDHMYMQTIRDLYAAVNLYDMELELNLQDNQIMVHTAKIANNMVHVVLQFRSMDPERYQQLDGLMSINEFKQLI